MRKKQALMKNEMDKRMAELVKFIKSFKVCSHRLMSNFFDNAVTDYD